MVQNAFSDTDVALKDYVNASEAYIKNSSWEQARK